MKFEIPRIFTFAFLLLPVLALSGCFTVAETEYPSYPMTTLSQPSSNEVSVVIRGFETTFVDTIPVQSYQSVYVPGYHGHRHYHPGYYETVRSTTYIDQARESDQFVQQASDRMEAAGFNIRANPADYIVEARFDGPFPGANDPGSLRLLYWLGSALMYDADADTWNAKLKIYDNHNGKLLFTRDYQEEYFVSCFSPLPLFGIACYPRTEKNYMQAWCLMALTDRLTSEASAFISARSLK